MAAGCTSLTHGSVYSESVSSESATIQPQTVPPSMLVRLTRSLSSQEWFLVFAALVSLYLINGAYAPIICSLCTTIPAVIHSYRIITDDGFCPEAYRATLCYWILQGALTGLDHLIGHTFAYYFLKFLLMSMVYTHMVSKCRRPVDQKTSSISSWQSVAPNASSEMTKLNKSTTEMAGAPLTSKDSSLTNFVKWRQNAGGDAEDDETLQHSIGEILKKNNDMSSPSVSKNPTASLAFFSPATSNFGEMPISSNDPISDFRDALDSPKASLQQTTERVLSHTTFSSTDWDRTWTAMPTSEMNRFQKPVTISQDVVSDSRTMLGRPVQKSSHETIPCYEGDIESVPDSLIIFRKPFTELQTIYLTNVTNNKILWAIKTNAVDKIIATPTCGLISAGATLHLKMAIREKAKIAWNDCGHDRLAIDYVFVDSSTVAFDPGLLVDCRNDLRRKAFEIKYLF